MALEQTEVCYRQDYFGIPNKGPRLCGANDDNDEDDNNDGDNVISNDNDVNGYCGEW